MPVLKRQFNRPKQKKMTWPDPNTINTKDDTVSNCGRGGLRYNNDINFRFYVFVIGAFFNKRARETSAAKASLGALPPILIAPKNATLKRAVDFQSANQIFFTTWFINALIIITARAEQSLRCKMASKWTWPKLLYSLFIAIILLRENVASVDQHALNASPARWTSQSHRWKERWLSVPRRAWQRKKLYVGMFVLIYLLL